MMHRATVPTPTPTPSGSDLAAGDLPDVRVPDDVADVPADGESATGWGFADTEFQVLPNRSVLLSGTRYALCGAELPALVPWVEQQLEIEIDPAARRIPSGPVAIPDARTNEAFLDELRQIVREGAISHDAQVRLRRGHGHCQQEIFALRYGQLERVPDLVVFPANQEEVEAIVAAAIRHDVCLVPYGGGTNVSGALACDGDDERMIVTIDLGRMNQVLWVNPTNRTACIQAGAVGRDIVDQLAAEGFTLGHEPDSIEFSTMGGWIATHASGMKKNRYGNIEDIVLDVTVVTPRGTLSAANVAPRESIGVDARRWVFGSEGTLGIITEAVVKIFPLPEVQQHDSILFHDFEAGMAFMYDLQRSGAAPASVRLMDNVQFQLGHTFKPAATGLSALKSKLETWVVTKLKGFDPDRLTACTLVFEGTRAETAAQQRVVRKLTRQHRGMRAGAANGERGYQLTFAIAYLRDFVMDHWLIGESFETSVAWSDALALCERVKQRMRDEHARRNLPGKPFVSCRVTQVYETGVCVYFYLVIPYQGVDDPSAVYAELEHLAREEILAAGGSLSHHHGVGKVREEFLSDVVSPATLACNDALKQAMDPTNVFGIGNQRSAKAA